MPIYEYSCQKCNAHVEILQKITDKPLSKCPKCGGKLEKQWSQTSFQLKGSGWYVTDYARKGGAEAKEKSDPATATTKSTTPATPETVTTTTANETKGETKKTKKEKPAAPSSSSKE